MPLLEKALIERIRRQVGRTATRKLVTGIGDDCAVLRIPSGHEALVTTDFSLEGIHFRREWHPPESVGHRCLARGLSDIAAMGGEPIAAFLSLALPHKLPQSWVDGFMHGFVSLAGKSGLILAGGDTAESPAGVLADIVVLGAVPRGKAVLRSAARPGDLVFVTGALGGAAAVLNKLFSTPKKKPRPTEYPQHFFPVPRLNVGRTLRERGLVSAMIDISDGLSTDLAHICEESHVGAEIRAEAIPRASIGRTRRPVDLRFALHGGDDYELLFTVPAEKRTPARIAKVPVTLIGQITWNKKIFLRNSQGVLSQLKPQGWQHFGMR